MTARATLAALAIAALAMGGCERGPARVTWDDPAGDVKPPSNRPTQPRLDIVRVEATGSDGALWLRMQFTDDLDRYFSYTRPDGKKSGGVAAQFFIDADNNARTGGHPAWARGAGRALQGYEYEISVRLGYRYMQDGASRYAYGDVLVDAAKAIGLLPGVVYAIAKLRQGSDSYDFATFKLPPGSREAIMKGSAWRANSIDIVVPYQWLGLKAGTTIRLCFRESAQGAASGKGFSEDRRLKLQ
jgi:hypothetical protein